MVILWHNNKGWKCDAATGFIIMLQQFQWSFTWYLHMHIYICDEIYISEDTFTFSYRMLKLVDKRFFFKSQHEMKPSFSQWYVIETTSHQRHFVSNHRSFDIILFNGLGGLASNKHQSPHYWPSRFEGNSPVTGEYPQQRARHAGKTSM